MDHSTAQHQEIPSHSLENMMVSQKTQERKPRPQPEQALKCPRCDSTNTKFCYYNNYSLSQPRYFCKSCRRYWTQGGTLRNVPVGGGCRKNKRSSSSSSVAKRSQDHPIAAPLPPPMGYDHHTGDLSLAFARFNDYDFSAFGMPAGVGSGDVVGSNGLGFVDATRNGYGSQNMYYGNFGDGGGDCFGGAENGGGYDQEYSNATTTAVTVTTMKQELFGGRENERILWGYPNWQMNGDGNYMGDFDSAGRESWNGINASSWHGLLNSPLM